MRLLCFCEWKRVVNCYPQRASLKEATQLRELRAVRANLCRGDNNSALRSFICIGESEEDGEQMPAALQCLQEATRGGTAQGIKNDVDVTNNILGNCLLVVDELIGSQSSQECFGLLRCAGDAVGTLHLRV